MAWTGKFAIGLLIIVLFTYFTLDIGYMQIADMDNDTSLERAAKAALSLSVNRGVLRESEQMVINEEISDEAFLRYYAENANTKSGLRQIQIFGFSAYPPMLAVESYTTAKSNFLQFTNTFDGGDKQYTVSHKKEEVIFESKN
ncbi:DUF5411 family protein [Microaerobacter geothermalis]|uniref:DUF5411 family protein n=1 Tax=Microaerobacter geothermalis TaxID=674972 RepID=UPI001F1E6116|nr:DUF5411 family protein [Microaerobacter geothermalis]MCF6094502.1 DUF5411 family protein [Microaerobacter geothermalis]